MDSTVRVLLAFRDGEHHGVREVARDLSMPKSTVSRIVIDLAEARLLSKVSNGSEYLLGSRVVQLGQVYLDNLSIASVAPPVIRQLRDALDETIGVQIREGSERVVVGSIESRNMVRSVLHIGQTFPLHAGAAGKALLAFESPERQMELLSDDSLVPLTENTITDVLRLRNELNAVRSQGFAISTNEVSRHSGSVAAPIFGARGELVGVLNVTGPVFRMSEERLFEYAPHAISAANDVSRLLGWSATKLEISEA